MIITAYINLDAAVDRRMELEDNFRRFAPDGWPLIRVPAISAAQAQEIGVGGAIRWEEKACFLSHLAVLKSAAAQASPLWIREDDTEIGQRSIPVLNAFLHRYPDTWDVLLADLTVGNPNAMMELLLARRHVREGEIQAIATNNLTAFAGALSYIIHPVFAAKLYSALETSDFQLPFDIALRQFLLNSGARAFVLFPFISTASELSKDSSVQSSDGGGLHQLWTQFRKLVWLDRDLKSTEDNLDQLIGADVESEPRIFGKLMQGLMMRKITHESTSR